MTKTHWGLQFLYLTKSNKVLLKNRTGRWQSGFDALLFCPGD
jgi:hypothetical protein